MGFLKKNSNFILAVAIVDRTFHREDFLYIPLVDLIAWIKDNEPEKGN
jgi:hypothetical protein